MAFDGSGNFTRSYDFETDRDNGIKILAARVDGEFDNFNTGMNQTFLRTGIVPMSGDLAMGTNRLTGLHAGSVASPSTKFAASTGTGIFLNSSYNMAVAINGVKIGEFTTAGLEVTGTSDVSALFRAAAGIVAKGFTAGATGIGLEMGVVSSTYGLVQSYDRTGVAVAPLKLSGSSITVINGELIRDSEGQYLNHVTAGLTGNVHRGTAVPGSGLGTDGDIYLQYI
jgi:hypothetical protein